MAQNRSLGREDAERAGFEPIVIATMQVKASFRSNLASYSKISSVLLAAV